MSQSLHAIVRYLVAIKNQASHVGIFSEVFRDQLHTLVLEVHVGEVTRADVVVFYKFEGGLEKAVITATHVEERGV